MSGVLLSPGCAPGLSEPACLPPPRRRFERFAEMCQDLPDRPRIGNERDESDVATTPRARKRKLLAHPSHELGPGNPRRVVRAGLVMRVGQPVEELKRREFDDAAGSRPRGFTAATPPDPVGGFVPWRLVSPGDSPPHAGDSGGRFVRPQRWARSTPSRENCQSQIA